MTFMNNFNIYPKQFQRHFMVRNEKKLFIGYKIYDDKSNLEKERKRLKKYKKTFRTIIIPGSKVRNYRKKYLIMIPYN